MSCDITLHSVEHATYMLEMLPVQHLKHCCEKWVCDSCYMLLRFVVNLTIHASLLCHLWALSHLQSILLLTVSSMSDTAHAA